MGAGVAAGPHCPVASNPAWEARRSALGGFERSAPEPGARSPLPPESVRGRSRFRFPRGLPDRAEALAVRRLADLELAFLLPAFAVPEGRSLRFRSRQDPRPKPRFRLAVHGPKSWVLPGSQLPGRSPVLPDRSEPKLFSAGGGALTEVPLSAGLVLDPKVRCPACPVPRARRPLVPVGALRSLPLSHPLKGKPASSAWRRLRQPPCLSLPPALPPEGDRPGIRSGCGWEGFPPLPEDRLGHIRKLSRKTGRAKRIPPVDNEDNGHKSPPPNSPPRT